MVKPSSAAEHEEFALQAILSVISSEEERKTCRTPYNCFLEIAEHFNDVS